MSALDVMCLIHHYKINKPMENVKTAANFSCKNAALPHICCEYNGIEAQGDLRLQKYLGIFVAQAHVTNTVL